MLSLNTIDVGQFNKLGKLQQVTNRLLETVDASAVGSLPVQEKVSIVRQVAKKFPYVDNLDQLKSLTAECGGFLSVSGAAQMLGCNRADIAKFERKGEISGFRLKTTFASDSETHDDTKDHIFIALDSVKAFVERKKQGTAAPKVVAPVES